MPVYDWNSDQDQIVARCHSYAPLKICVKVLDDESLVEGWLQHHGNIVGLQNIIVADNCSTNAKTLKIYEEYSNLATIFRFQGPHNEIHWHPRFQPLFEAIKETSRYCSFIDIDERLVRIVHSSWLADASIVQLLDKPPNGGIIPCTWLINTLSSYNTFSLLDTEGTSAFENNLRWGKPILPVELLGLQPGIHNVQFGHSSFSTDLGVSLFLLHLTQFPERRVAANRNKLISRGIVDKAASIQQILATNFHGVPDQSVARLVDEIGAMWKLIEGGRADLDPRMPPHLKLLPDGRIYFSDDRVRATFFQFLNAGQSLINQMFNDDLSIDASVIADPSALVELAKALRSQGDGRKADLIFLRGMDLYPDVTDAYGGPAFRKELLRTYLARREWRKAESLVPNFPAGVGNRWHAILFARAFHQAEDHEMAKRWWAIVLDDEPTNGEAQDALNSLD